MKQVANKTKSNNLIKIFEECGEHSDLLINLRLYFVGREYHKKDLANSYRKKAKVRQEPSPCIFLKKFF